MNTSIAMLPLPANTPGVKKRAPRIGFASALYGLGIPLRIW